MQMRRMRLPGEHADDPGVHSPHGFHAGIRHTYEVGGIGQRPETQPVGGRKAVILFERQAVDTAGGERRAGLIDVGRQCRLVIMLRTGMQRRQDIGEAFLNRRQGFRVGP